jgi:hypothetical protein
MPSTDLAALNRGLSARPNKHTLGLEYSTKSTTASRSVPALWIASIRRRRQADV